MLDATDLYRRLRYDLCDMGIPLERAAAWAYEALQAVMAGGSVPRGIANIEQLEEAA